MNDSQGSDYCLVVAHRGARLLAPENTIESIAAALKFGIWGVEFDVDLSQDLAPIVIHQETLEPDEIGTKLKLVAALPERAWSLEWSSQRIKSLDAGTWFDAKFDKCRVPTLEQVFALDWGTKFCVMELKDPTYWSSKPDLKWPQKMVAAVHDQVKSLLSHGGKLLVLSFNPLLLSAFAEKFPQVPRNLALWTNSIGQREKVLRQAQELGCHSVSVADFMVEDDKSWCSAIENYGMRPGVYEMSDQSDPLLKLKSIEKRWQALIESGVKLITTDYPVELANFIKKRVPAS